MKCDTYPCKSEAEQGDVYCCSCRDILEQARIEKLIELEERRKSREESEEE